MRFLKILVKNRGLLFNLSKSDFRSRYSGSLFGILWAFIQPLITILVFWFVFQLGFKNPPVNNMPYILWFIPAYIPWIFFSDIFMSTTTCLHEYNYLVKKVKFNVEILPFIKIITALMVHLFFIVFIFLIYIFYQINISIYNIQVIYYTISVIALGAGIGLIFSALSIFFKDLIQIVSIILQIGFWMIPIFWNPDSMSENIVFLLKFNPMFYIVQGYRESFIYKKWFWEHPLYTVYFWGIVLVILILGMYLFKKLRPHFADEL